MLGIIANYVTYCVGMIIFFLLLSFFIFSIGEQNIIGRIHSSILHLILRRFDSLVVIKINIIIATVFSVPLSSFGWRHFLSLRVLLRGKVWSYMVRANMITKSITRNYFPLENAKITGTSVPGAINTKIRYAPPC